MLIQWMNILILFILYQTMNLKVTLPTLGLGIILWAASMFYLYPSINNILGECSIQNKTTFSTQSAQWDTNPLNGFNAWELLSDEGTYLVFEHMMISKDGSPIPYKNWGSAWISNASRSCGWTCSNCYEDHVWWSIHTCVCWTNGWWTCSYVTASVSEDDQAWVSN